ncbi:MAG: chemotaxis response regulator protein-glutamate methylesterase [Gemmatimonadaceae bacterium]
MSSNDVKPRVLVVDDSAFMRLMTTQILEGSGEFVVCGTARNGFDAITQVHELNPDVVTLDVDMPEMDGLNALGYIMSETPRPVVMLSAGTTAGGKDAALRALELGAVDFLLKPSGSISLDLRLISERIVDAVRAAASANPAGLRMLPTATWTSVNSRRSGTVRLSALPVDGDRATQVVLIASSTGGPRALAAIVPRLPKNLPAAVLVVQHMPPGFTRSLAARLDGMSDIHVTEGEEGDALVNGRMYVAPGGYHMTVCDNGAGAVIALDASAALWGVRPAADILFTSAARLFGSASLAVVLTGMGRDGAAGARLVRLGGGRTLIQDKATSTIFGMPQAALSTAGADRLLPLNEIGPAIAEMVEAAAYVR